MNRSALDGVSSSSSGAPDCWHIDTNGKSSPEVFCKHFGIPRRYRHDRGMLDSMMNRQTRLERFFWALLHYRNLSAGILLEGDKYVSPEAHALERFDEGWHLRQKADLTEVAKLENEDRNKMLIELRQVRKSVTWKHHVTKAQALANRDNTTIDDVIEAGASCALESWLRARSALKNWSSLNARQRAELAEAIFCGFTFFGKRALEEAYALEPAILSYYKSFLRLPCSAEIEPLPASDTGKVNAHVPGGASDAAVPELAPAPSLTGSANNLGATLEDDDSGTLASEPTSMPENRFFSESAPTSNRSVPDADEVPRSLRELYALIGHISLYAQSDPNVGSGPAERIKCLLDQCLQGLIELQVKLPADVVLRLIERYCSAVLQTIETLEFRHSDQRDLVPVLMAAWKRTVIAALEQGRSRSWFELNINERRVLPELAERYASESQKIAEANAEIDSIRAQLAEAKYTARTALKVAETRRQGEITAAQGELDAIRVEAAHHLLPEGRRLDDLMEDPNLCLDSPIDVGALNPAAVKALKELVEALDGIKEDAPSTPVKPADAPAAATPVAVAPPCNAAPALDAEPRTMPVAIEPPQSATPAGSLAIETVRAEPVEVQPALEAPPVLGPDVARATPPLLPAAVSELAQEVSRTTEQSDSAPGLGEELVEEAPTGSPQDGLESALRHLQPTESREEAQKAFRIAYDQFSQVPSGVVEAMALHWLDAGHLNVAYRTLRDATDTTLVTGRVLDADLVRSAFYGMNMWPKDRDALSHVQRDLNFLNYNDLEEQLQRKPSGKLVPYLIVCATLHPALFAGRETQAPSLLRVAAEYFDGALKQLIVNVSDFTMRGGRVDLDALRDQAGKETHLVATRLHDQVRTWVDLNAHRTTRWAPLRIALRTCADKPVFAGAIQAIQDGEKGDVAAVRLFVDTYSDHSQTRQLLDDLLDEIRVDYAGPNDQADSPAYAIFQQQVEALIAICREWLLEVAPSKLHQMEVSEFLKRFHTQLDRSIAQLIGHPRFTELEHRAGSSLLLRALTTLKAEIEGEGPARWHFDQTDATFHLPEVLSRLDIDDVGINFRLEWFAMRLTSPDWLGEMIELAKRQEAHWVHLLLLRQLETLGQKHDADIESVNTKIAGTRAELKKAIEQFKSLSIQALSDDVTMSADAIPEEEHLSNMLQASEWLERLEQSKPFADVSPIADEVKRLTRALDKQLGSMARSLEGELNQGLLQLRTRLSAGAVPEEWEAKARAALERRNLTVVRELVNQLEDHLNRNAVLTVLNNQENVDLANFLTVEDSLHTLLSKHPNPREAGDRIIDGRAGGFEYSQERSSFKDTVETLLEWRNRGQSKKPTLEKRIYEGIVQTLNFIGFEPVEKSGTADTLRNCEYSTTGDFRRLKIRIERPTLPKGFPLFEGDHLQAVALNVIFVQGDWSLPGLLDLIERHGLPSKAVLLVGDPLSPDERRAFSRFCRERKCTIFLVDPVVVAFLATLPSHQALKTMLHVTSAWTFYNPYTKGDARQPAPPEMRFGREHDVASLVEPRGAALVYGGRQLGKTTLLHSAVQKFRQMDPARNHAFYLRMDGQFQHAVERGIDVKTQVLDLLVNQLTEASLLSQASASRAAEERLQAEFRRTGQSRVLFCLDEIDSVLDRDARTNFQLVRSLAALVNDPHQRFRVVFAGLNNVNRFRTMPNVPLEQLGSPLQVKILPAADARSLILQPLTALGYRFEDEGLVDRIMAFTNCHPSLLHIFCSELVEQMALDRAVNGGPRLICLADVDNVESNSGVRRLSGDRFDMTLNLDRRYTVAVYGLIKQYGKSIGKFTVKQALDVARELVPEEFEQMSEAGFESLLEELVGLGVLRVTDKVMHQYAMRNQSILQLVGSPNDIAHKLQMAVRDLAQHAEDVLTCHAANASHNPSPLSLQDERQILQSKAPDGAPRYSVTVVMGSLALGLSTKWIQEGFTAINEFRSGHVTSRYETKPITESHLLEPKRFQEVINTAINDWAMGSPTVLLVQLDEIHSIDRIMDLLSIANESASRATKMKHELRIVFLLGPLPMWSWHSHPWITSSPDAIGGVVELNRWTRHACESLLDQQGLDVTPEQARLLHEATEGWYLSLLRFIEVRKKREKDRASSFGDFAKDFKPVAKLPAREFEKFVEYTGMNSVVWSMPLALQLMVFDSLDEFSVEDLQAAIELLDGEFSSYISPEQAASVLRWWTGLRVIEANTKEASKRAGKGELVTFRFTRAMQRAIAESSSAAAALSEAQE